MAFEDLFGGTSAVQARGCPNCKKADWDVRTSQWGILRICRKCGHEWSGGTVGANQPNFSEAENLALVPPPGVPAPDDGLPASQYTGAGFRDPGKNFNGDD